MKRSIRKFTAAFKAKVAIEALKECQTLAQPSTIAQSMPINRLDKIKILSLI
jgi:hypothetical protein